ncbi:hypothetical protein [Corallococcus sp. M7]
MRLKTIVASFAFGSLLMACGGMEGEEGVAQDTQPSLVTSEQGLCEGYAAGARICTFRCTAGGGWYAYPVNSVPYGQCQDYANSFCGGTAAATCWSF